MSESNTIKTMQDSNHNFAVIGLVIALIAFSLSLYSSSIMKSYKVDIETQSSENIEKVIDTEEIKPEEPQSNFLKTTVLLLALGAILNGFLGLLRQNQRYIGGTAILVALTAIIIQYLWITITILIVVIVIAAILLSLGVEF